MTRLRIFTIAAALIAAVPCAVRAQADYETGKRSWLQGDYPNAYNTLLEYRKQPFGRRPEVDYMIGTCACRMDCCRTWGFRFLGAIPESYPVSAESRALISDEQKACDPGAGAQLPARDTLDRLQRMVAAGVTGRAKVFSAPDKDVGISTYPARRIRDISPAEFAARLTPRGNPSQAIDVASRLAGAPSVKAYDRFVIASLSNHSSEAMDRVAATLETFLAFLRQHYQIDLPDRYVTIYLVPQPQMLRKLADRLHGLDVTPGTIGYAFQDDLSIVAFVTGEGVGTVFHELVHLSVRSTFGDIPQWLDEGLAGLYEVSTIYPDGVYGEPNWRQDVLKGFWHARPMVEQLIETAWFPFEVPEANRGQIEISSQEAERQVAFMAMARYFSLFLEREGHLTDVYKAVRNRDILAGVSGAAAARHALESAYPGATLVHIDKRFEGWFRAGVPTTKQLGSRPGGAPVIKELPGTPVTRELPSN